jgi:MFS family permease
MNNVRYRFILLVIIVGISGFSQGMLLPLISILLDQAGTSTALNGFHASALYIGILIISPFMEKPLRKYGYKPIIVTGLLLVILSIASFPIWHAFWFWFILRLMVGIGDHMLHFATQTWITSTSPEHKRGRHISMYGLSFGLGFALGPMTIQLLKINDTLPFLVSAGLSFIVWLMLWRIKNELPESELEYGSPVSSFQRYKKVLALAWTALLPGFAYGFLEASLNGNFPVYATRFGIQLDWVSILLPAFIIGSLFSQIPLGIISDRFGRRKVLLIVLSFGTISFSTSILVEHSMILLTTTLLLSGIFIGSLFSLGIAYMADILPKNLIPTGNLMSGVAFSIGSMFGPFIGGIFIDTVGRGSIFYSISGMLFIVLIIIKFTKPLVKQEY